MVDINIVDGIAGQNQMVSDSFWVVNEFCKRLAFASFLTISLAMAIQLPLIEPSYHTFGLVLHSCSIRACFIRSRIHLGCHTALVLKRTHGV